MSPATHISHPTIDLLSLHQSFTPIHDHNPYPPPLSFSARRAPLAPSRIVSAVLYYMNTSMQRGTKYVATLLGSHKYPGISRNIRFTLPAVPLYCLGYRDGDGLGWSIAGRSLTRRDRALDVVPENSDF